MFHCTNKKNINYMMKARNIYVNKTTIYSKIIN